MPESVLAPVLQKMRVAGWDVRDQIIGALVENGVNHSAFAQALGVFRIISYTKALGPPCGSSNSPLRMPTDIFPEIDIPIVSVIWSYSGITPEEMAEAITVRSERGFTSSVNDIEHMESQSLPGLGTC
jgi:hypothetical protein